MNLTASIRAAYEQLAGAYDRKIDTKPHNAYYDRPNTLSLLPEVNGLHVLDAGCGPGKYAEILLEQGARVTGYDLSPAMVDLARVRTGGRAEFFVHNMAEQAPNLAPASFDGVLCALALHYAADWTPVIQEFARVVKPGGFLVASFEHPFFEYTYFESDRYFDIEPVSAVWKGFGIPVRVPSFRRPLQECLAPILENGFYLDCVLEPRPTEEFREADPRHFEELNQFPGFLCVRAIRRS